MTKKILISWLGDSDIRNFNNDADEIGGPLHSVLASKQYGPFDALWLFMTPRGVPRGLEANAREIALTRIGQLCAHLKMEIIPTLTPDNFEVANMERIYRFMIGKLADLARQNRGPRTELFYNLTSGTPAMYAIQLYLASQGDFCGTPLYTVHPGEIAPSAQNGSNVFTAALPFMLGRNEGNFKSGLAPYTEPNQAIFDQVRIKVANSDASVLIWGETGTGKSELARYIHAHDQRRGNREMVEVNCAALGADANSRISELFGHKKGAFTGADKERKGAFAKADGSTLFLDEIGEIPLEHQGLLLRAIADRRIKPLGAEKEEEVHPRIIAATNIDLPEAVRAGKFRADLYYRLAHYAPRLKPVREYTKEQKEQILSRLLDSINSEYHPHHPRKLSAEASRLLLNHPWPGNIREMKFRLRSICLLADHIVSGEDVLEQLSAMPSIEGDMDINDVRGEPASFNPPARACQEAAIPRKLSSWLENWEKYWLRSSLFHHPTQANAAKRLGMSPTTFSSKKKKFGL